MNKNRGMFLESAINKTIKFYNENDIAIFHKKDLPVSVRSVKKVNGKLEIGKGFIKGKSTTDYYGLYDGIFVAFEAKSTIEDKFVLSNIKKHQFDYLDKVTQHGGCGFFIIYFSASNECFLIKQETIKPQIMKSSTKSLHIDFFRKNANPIELTFPGLFDFVPMILDLV